MSFFVAVLTALHSSFVAMSAIEPTQEMPHEGVAERQIAYTVSEGTWLNIDVSPDGESLAFDLLGDLYVIPIGGGHAERITSGYHWDRHPKFSACGRFLYFVSDRVGLNNVWRLDLSSGELVSITDFDVADPFAQTIQVTGGLNWDIDRERLLFAMTGDFGDMLLASVDVVTEETAYSEAPETPFFGRSGRLRRGIKIFSGVMGVDRTIYFSEGLSSNFGVEFLPNERMRIQMYGLTPDSSARIPITPEGASFHDFRPQVSSDGALLAYFRQYPDRRTEIRVVSLPDFTEVRVFDIGATDDAAYTVYDDGPRPNYAFSPDARRIYFWNAGQIYFADIETGNIDQIHFTADVELDVRVRATSNRASVAGPVTASTIRWPDLNPKTQDLVFSAGGYIWVQSLDLPNSPARRITDSDDFEYMPALSPDGAKVAFTQFRNSPDGIGAGQLWVANLDDGASWQILGDNEYHYFNPSWSPDGTRIAVTRAERTVRGFSSRQHGWIDLETEQFNPVGEPLDRRARRLGFINGTFVGFDSSGEELFISTAVSRSLVRASFDEILLSRYNLTDNTKTQLAELDEFYNVGLIPSPASEYAVLRAEQRLGLRLMRLVEGGAQDGRVVLDEVAHPVSELGALSFVRWVDADHFIGAWGRKVVLASATEGWVRQYDIVAPSPKNDSCGSFVITGSRVITMSGESGAGDVYEDGAIEVECGTLSYVGPVDQYDVADGTVAIDGTGLTVIPGLLDTHYHAGVRFNAQAIPADRFNDRSAIAFGVTTGWEPAGARDDGTAAHVDLLSFRRILGPRLSHTAIGSVGFPYDQLNSLEAARATVRGYVQLGVTTIKEYDAQSREQQRWLQTAAFEQGIGIVSHIDYFDQFMTRIVDGYTGGDHPFIPTPLYDDVLELLEQTGFVWTPNVTITYGAIGLVEDRRSYFWSEVLENHPEARGRHEALTGGTIEMSSPAADYTNLRAHRVAIQAAQAAELGIAIGVSAHNRPASGVHEEMWHLWRGGMPAAEVLRSATMVNAEKIGLQDEIGSIEVGKIADLLILRDNPLDNILHTLSIEYTVQGGVIYDAETAEPVDPAELVHH